MRKSFFAAAFFAVLPLVATAMPHEHHPRPHAEHTAPDLSREQHRQIMEAKRTSAKERIAIEKRYLAKLPAAEQQAMEKELKTVKEREQQTLDKLLTPEQKKARDERNERRKAQASEWAEFKKWQAEQKKP